ncbi:tetratricopeptide repeat protein [Abyssalbus ytuae]|uniref:Tetratricopeptide repeat protein n=1 Tax=Abyssalbus ytuae TaxID=2926907 RepID=A0A9E6ZP27_9FLAO|nr:tetratricopeptide repeat protein [Abyssalbus ytuae]UOB16113.1 tetratricopeptide repeat protein [Abyssalbus ytuae]
MKKETLKVIISFKLIILWGFLLFSGSSCNRKKEEYIPVSEQNTTVTFLSAKVIPDNDFAGSENCRECHPDQFKQWKGSHHDKAMQIAQRETVLAKFEGEVFKSQGVTSRFFENEGGFYVNTEGPDGEYHDYKIVYTFGITPLQQYIVKFPDGRYQCLRTAWDTRQNKWFDLYPDFKVVHSEWLHWSRGGLNWNNMCSDCHSTNVRENYDPNTLSYDTKFSIINVSCEACHGPGKKHMENARLKGDKYDSKSTYMQMTGMTKPKELVDQCARCHMRREQISGGFNFEGTLLDHYFPQLIEPPLYHADGQILDEVYVYGSFIQSKMYQNNVSCNNCHDSHSLKLKFEGNKLCFQCHDPEKYETPSHHFHEGITEAVKCVNCHMTGKIYMGNDFRRDHSFRIPRPDLSLKYGTPNACTQCHTEKDDKWAWEAFKKQYGEPEYTHFSEKLARGISGESNSHHSLLELISDETQPEIVRASAVKAISYNENFNNVELYIKLLNDQSALVRGVSLDILGENNSSDYFNYLLPKLKDAKRSVRIKAFFSLAAIPGNLIPEDYKEIYKTTEKEFLTYLDVNADFAEGLAKKAIYYQRKGELIKAKETYQQALKIDDKNYMVRTNLANLYYTTGEPEKAEKAFKKIIEQEPEFGFSYYSLALLFAELGRIDEAIIQMEKAYKLMPSNHRVIYNLALLYEKKGNFIKAKKVFDTGLKLDPDNEELLYALAFHYLNQNKKEEALNITQKMIDLYPDKPLYQNLLNKIKSDL